MKYLTVSEIEKLASRSGVKRIAVENFLMTLHESSGEAGNLYNLKSDARVYGWNARTVAAIKAGIKAAFIADPAPKNLASFIVNG